MNKFNIEQLIIYLNSRFRYLGVVMVGSVSPLEPRGSEAILGAATAGIGKDKWNGLLQLLYRGQPRAVGMAVQCAARDR